MKQPLITNIQRYSIHDGDGIRTTVFFKGCNMACRWCHNPETQDFSAEPMRNPDRCSGCGRCAELCPEHAISINDGGISVTDRDKCVRCGECVDECYNEARTISGRAYGYSRGAFCGGAARRAVLAALRRRRHALWRRGDGPEYGLRR